MTRENLISLTIKLYNLTLLMPKKEPLRCRVREAADDILSSFIGHKQESNGFSLQESLDIMDGYLEVAKSQNWIAALNVLEIQQEYAKIKRDLDSFQRIPRAEHAGDIDVKEKTAVDTAKRLENSGLSQDSAPSLESKANSSIQVVKPAPLMAPIPDSVPAFAESKKSGEPEDEDDDDDDNILTESQVKRQRVIVDFLKQKGQAQVWEIQKIFPDISKRTIRRDFRSLLKQGLIERVGERNKTYYKMKFNLS